MRIQDSQVTATTEESDREEKTTESQPSALDSHEEKESNNQIPDANVIQYGGRTKGVIGSDKDRDYYKFRTPDQSSGKTRVILRKLSTGGFLAWVQVYDQVESDIKLGSKGLDNSVTFAFDSTTDSDYYIMVKSIGAGGPYELEVREE